MVVIDTKECHTMPSTSLQINPTSEYDQITELVPRLHICGANSLSLDNMNKYNISLIINATTEKFLINDTSMQHLLQIPSVRSLGSIPRIKLWLDDTPSTNIYQYFDLISDQIETVIATGGNVLVHCVAGISRSATICLAFLTKFRCRSLRQAYHLMARKRSLVRPNIGFWHQLIIYEHEIKNGVASVKFVQSREDPKSILPDVYLSTSVDLRGGRRFSKDKPKFQPILETVPESTEVYLLSS
uniref:Dual specificity phosphatase n=1 Tax=Loa loa TaxID=7209 RepID=A0A1I7VEL0_LOALO